jgi:hypothetical protein
MKERDDKRFLLPRRSNYYVAATNPLLKAVEDSRPKASGRSFGASALGLNRFGQRCRRLWRQAGRDMARPPKSNNRRPLLRHIASKQLRPYLFGKGTAFPQAARPIGRT